MSTLLTIICYLLLLYLFCDLSLRLHNLNFIDRILLRAQIRQTTLAAFDEFVEYTGPIAERVEKCGHPQLRSVGEIVCVLKVAVAVGWQLIVDVGWWVVEWMARS
ncbi:hypothetical protein BDZ85DRAFT_278910 [Elsinoe ampelina]|uniref:Uncharacterized protein n=1 Tax=Elsinoe ampelina TaxID=302913 RepID=A0A6A6GN46_9PEZI|nr:hypothetical protein BDZ85DRAFT_278910 [Elsinoe ampelina]